MSKWIKCIGSDGMDRGTSKKRRNGMLQAEEVPHEIRKDFFSVYWEGWDVGREEEKRCCLLFLNVVCSPGRILGWVSIVAVLLEEISSFLSLHHFAMHFCLAIDASFMYYIYLSVFAWHY
jgi:hypothetical protein